MNFLQFIKNKIKFTYPVLAWIPILGIIITWKDDISFGFMLYLSSMAVIVTILCIIGLSIYFDPNFNII